MHRCVPDFEVEDDDPLPSSTAHVRRKSSSSFDEEPPEISWQRGPVVQPVQGDRSRWRSPPGLPSAAYAEIPDRMEPVTGGGVGFSAEAAADLFMEEDEMVAWFHHQINEEQDDGRGNLYEQFLGSSQGAGCSVRATPEREAAPLPAAPRRQGTVVAWRDSRASETLTSGKAVEAESRSVVFRTCEQGVASSSDVSVERAVREDRKMKAKEAEDPLCHSEDANFERGKKGKDVCRSASARRTRAADVHNLSERRRRDRINEKMKALQGLIPRCNKSDKASMLDEAIEYVKSLQLQVQMMSMGCNMGPMIFPGMQAYLPPMGMGMNMGMGIGMGTWIPMGTEISAGEQGRPIFPFGPALPGPPIPGHSPVHLAVRPFMPLLHPPSMTIPNQFRVLASNQQDAAPNSVSMQGSMVMQLQNVVDPHHLYTSPHGLQTLPRSQPMAGEGTGKEIDNTEKSKC